MTQAELAALLRRINGKVRRLGTRDHLRVQQIVASDLAADHLQLRAALASALAQGPEQWDGIAESVDHCVARPEGRRPRSRTATDLLAAITAPPPRPRRHWRAAVAGALAVLVLAAGLLWWVKPPPPPEDRQPPDRHERPERPEPPTGVLVTERQAERRESVPWQPPVQREPAVLWLLLGGAAALGSLLGLHLVLLSGGAARRREAEALAARERLSQAELKDQDPLRPVYRAEAGLPFEESVVDDSALYLGRLFQPEAGQGLDVAATVRRTLDAGGQLTLVRERRRAARELLVLVDREKGDHPWLWGIQRLLTAWERRGVAMLRYRFQHMPAYLQPPGEGEPVSLGELGRRHEGAALVIFSRRLMVRGQAGEAGWLAELTTWPVRAWVDPDPRQPAERGDAGDVRRLVEAGLVRFPYSAQGLVALARHLCADGQGAGALEWPPYPGGQAVHQQVRLLATVAAMVPDPTWEHIDGLRRLLGEDVGRLSGPWYVQRLLEYLRQDLQVRDPEEGVRWLCLSREAVDRLIRAQRGREGQKGLPGPLERRVREQLLAAIADDSDGAPGEAGGLWRLRRDLARARHQAVLAPERATELMGRFFGSAVAFEAREEAAAEAARQPRGWDGVRALLGGGVRLAEVLRGGWHWALLAAPGVALLGLWGAGWGLGLLAKLAGAGWHPEAEVIWPRTVQVARVEAPKPEAGPEPPRPVPVTPIIDDGWKKATAYRARMVKIMRGRFQMGSAKDEGGHQDDEVLHSVRISRDFLLGTTEVTQGQYREVLGESPSDNKGSTLPMEKVSWVDAAKYCNKLSEIEKLEPCYLIKGENVAWPKLQGCAGYRLPTEAEWEYAARGGKTTLYAGSNSLDEVGWYRDNAGGKPQPVAGKKLNGYGLNDMSGNVWEWVWDWLGEYPAGAVTDPIGSRSGRNRVRRGGSWHDDAGYARVAYRSLAHPGARGSYLGFRLARSLP